MNIKKERDRFVALAFCRSDVLLELDTDARVVFVGGASESLLGETMQSMQQKPLCDFISDEDKPLVRAVLLAARKRGRFEDIRVRFRNASRPVSFAGYVLNDLGGHYYLSLSRLTSPHKKIVDGVSGLLDSGSYNQKLKELVSRQPLPPGSQVTMIELREFDDLRSRLDETAGKNLFNTIGSTLRVNSIDGDAAAALSENRYSLVHGTGVAVDDLKQQITNMTRDADPLGKGVEIGTASIPVSNELEHGASPEDLANGLVFAINKFRNAKDSTFTIENLTLNMKQLVHQASETVLGFRKIVRDNAFEIAFQPIASIADDKIHHYEALVRFDKDEGSTSPYETVIFAEETGLISDFDMAMLRKVVDRMSGAPRDGSICAAVNISGKSLLSSKYQTGLFEIFDLYPWTQRSLMFEITESSKIGNLDDAGEVIKKIRAHGYKVCLDDFGAGAANFEYLSTLDVDIVKFDGPVVRNAYKVSKGRAFLKALSNLCRDLGVETIAEMIEDEAMYQFAKDCGVMYVQGYFIGKPAPDFITSP
ncbi:sensor domain-containing phosphodiesterase [Varunaivibrio sulfuroxidans]|uniref:EAL domain-containing protein (Putative c-di-GMP-specific phosphodiesterase class I) n=1 Tax=Varunaivibrio sulfuroxidans TaxID=1773489 RepID=A0A4R3JGL5_9PROT|nr:EAL domain-containing protein [Varunaivibrio sulfuroxidans]TCS64356.1 EAL domain-containing protein (putative c-di-GMP-specific phosphodiesterase class I) [Varunaivibrio sulfuroxidans]WES31208.1 EAL domain-containing protein [Varunaivibrio sulfuroxidans]